jgi:hypothetical protein
MDWILISIGYPYPTFVFEYSNLDTIRVDIEFLNLEMGYLFSILAPEFIAPKLN